MLCEKDVIRFKYQDITIRIVEDVGGYYFAFNDIQHALRLGEYRSYKVNFKQERKHFKIKTRAGFKKLIFIDEINLKSYLSTCRQSIEIKSSLLDCLIENGFITKSIVMSSYDELEFIQLLKSVLLPFDLHIETQKYVFGYKIDLYIPKLKIAIEYDEMCHRNYNHVKELQRQEFIEKELDCTFVRVDDAQTHGYNVGVVLKSIFNL